MKSLLRRLDRWWLAPLLLWLAPFALLFALGLFWLSEHGAMLHWAGLALLLGAIGYGLQYWQGRRERGALDAARTQADPDWPDEADGAWSRVESLAAGLDTRDWPLDDQTALMRLGRRTLEQVASCYHPETDYPLLELRVPHTLLVIERASRDLRESITANVPFSHRLTVGALARAYRWKPFAERLLGLHGSGRWVPNPASALLGQAWSQLLDRAYAGARRSLYQWLLQEYVRKLGHSAIALYSGRLLLAEEEPLKQLTQTVQADPARAPETAPAACERLAEEPLRILILGRSSTGKSSLISALFGQLRAATDLLPDTTRTLTPYRLERQGMEIALVFDSPGSERLSHRSLQEIANPADMILWVSAAHRPDRQVERQTLDTLRTLQAARVDRRPPPLLVVVTHIDRLRPLREWLPPYDLTDTSNLKAMSIQAAIAALASDLEVPIANVIPVCLAEGRVYNVEDSLWAAVLDQIDRAQRVRLLRCQDVRRREENWKLLRRQLANAGRFLLALPRPSPRNP
jgi:uncharacterized protein